MRFRGSMSAAEHNSFCSRWRCQTLRECSFVRLLVLLSLALFLSRSLSLSPCRMLEETRGHARTHPTCLFAFGSVQKSHRIQLSCTLSAALTRIFIRLEPDPRAFPVDYACGDDDSHLSASCCCAILRQGLSPPVISGSSSSSLWMMTKEPMNA